MPVPLLFVPFEKRKNWYGILLPVAASMEVKTAIITAGVSLVVALLSAITALINGRVSSRTSKSLELLKYTLAIDARQAELSSSETVEALASLRLSMQAIQRLKDEIQLITNATETSLSAKEALDRVRDSAHAVLETYQQKHPYLESDEALVLHRAKNTAFSVQNILTNGLHGKKYASQLAPEIVKALQELRTDLTESQNLLRDLKTDRFVHLSIKKVNE